MVKVIGVPVQLTETLLAVIVVMVAVTEMVAVTGAEVVLAVVNTGRLPVPLSANPMDGVLFVQLYTMVPPVVGLAKVTAVVAVALQNTLLGTAVTVAVIGCALTEEAVAVEVQPAFAAAVILACTVYVAEASKALNIPVLLVEIIVPPEFFNK
jgi:hypothetical protein